MRFKQDEIDLTTIFGTWADANLSAMPIDYINMASDVAASGTYVGMKLRFRVARLSTGSQFIGKDGTLRRYRNYGSVLMQVVGPQGEGSGRLLTVADLVGEAFRSKRQGGIHCGTPSAGPTVESGATASVTVSVPYTSDFKI